MLKKYTHAEYNNQNIGFIFITAHPVCNYPPSYFLEAEITKFKEFKFLKNK